MQSEKFTWFFASTTMQAKIRLSVKIESKVNKESSSLNKILNDFSEEHNNYFMSFIFCPWHTSSTKLLQVYIKIMQFNTCEATCWTRILMSEAYLWAMSAMVLCYSSVQFKFVVYRELSGRRDSVSLSNWWCCAW